MASAPVSETEVAHTPGPWEVRGQFIGPRLSSDSGIQIKVARVAGTDENSVANARLIAGAPLLQLARATLFDAIKHGDEEHRAWLKDAIDKHFADADRQIGGAA